MSRLFALLVGIDQYHPESRVAPLRGCVADIEAMDAFLRATYASRFSAYHPLLLRNHEATRRQVLHSFETHLGRATRGDTVLYYYSGHGARERTAPPFEPWVPDGYHESLVCYDSRTSAGYDLSDKELAVCLHRLSANGAHLLVILDCCHSGSGTRHSAAELRLGAVRQTYSRQEPRPYESFLDGWYAARFPQGSGLHIPQGRHLLLSACRRREKAFELTTDRGHFSTHLLQAWNQLGPDASYVALFQRTRQLMMGLTTEQHPQLDTSAHFNPYVAALTGTTADQVRKLTVWFDAGRWWAGLGAVHGLDPCAAAPPRFQLTGPDGSCRYVEGLRIGAERTLLPPLPDSWKGQALEAQLLTAPKPAMGVFLDADAAGRKRFDRQAASWKPVYFQWSDAAEAAPFQLVARADHLTIARTADNLHLRTLRGDDDAAAFADALDYLERIGKYHRLLELQNDSSQLHPQVVQWQLRTARGTWTADSVVLALPEDAPTAEVPFELQVRNDGPHPLHVAVYYLSPYFGIFRLGDNMWIEPGQVRTFLADTFRLPQGDTPALDVFKLIASTHRLDDFEMAQDHLPIGETVIYAKGEAAVRSPNLSRLVGGFAPPSDVSAFDWTTRLLRVELTRSRQAGRGRLIESGRGILRVLPHPHFRAEMRLRPLPPERALQPLAFLHELTRREGAQLVPLDSGARHTSGAPYVLEWHAPQGVASLANHPLEIELHTPLSEGEHLLCLCWDDPHLLPCGLIEERGATTRVRLHHLPKGATTEHSPAEPIRLFFVKISHSAPAGRLRRLVAEEGRLYHTTEGLPQAARHARNILLLVHGLIGDTRPLAECIAPLLQGGPFDLVLAFDCTHWHAPLEESARHLREELQHLGLLSDREKALSFLAHGTGGLLCRYFIEHLDGHRLARQLVMAGTPNGGSALAHGDIWRDVAQGLCAFAINSGWGFSAAAPLVGLLNGAQHLRRTLEQLHPDKSDLLRLLASKPDPGVPYHVLAGDYRAFRKRHPEKARLGAQLAAMGWRIPYEQAPNDLAAKVDALAALPPSWKHVRQYHLAAHHLNYFSLAPARDLIRRLLAASS